jgi:hypothetical protein
MDASAGKDRLRLLREVGSWSPNPILLLPPSNIGRASFRVPLSRRSDRHTRGRARAQHSLRRDEQPFPPEATRRSANRDQHPPMKNRGRPGRTRDQPPHPCCTRLHGHRRSGTCSFFGYHNARLRQRVHPYAPEHGATFCLVPRRRRAGVGRRRAGSVGLRRSSAPPRSHGSNGNVPSRASR